MFEPYENQSSESPEETVYRYTSAQEAPVAEPVVIDAEPIEEEPAAVPTPAKKEKNGWPVGAMIAIALLCSFLGGIIGASGMLLGSWLLGPRM